MLLAMTGSEHLTSEWLRKKFKNHFDLCNTSIKLAQSLLKGGQFASVDEILEEVGDQADEQK